MPPTFGVRAYAGRGRIRYAAHLRGLNLERVLGVALDRPGPFTRAELIAATGLSAPTVGSLALALIERGLLTDLGTGPSRGGRRPSTMELNARYGFVAAVHLGPTRTWLAVADLRGEVLERRAVETPRRVGPGPLLSKVALELRRLLRDLRVPAGRLLAVGAGAPGVVDWERGMVVALAPNLEGWSRVPMGTMLKRALKAPVLVDNDVNLAILGEHGHGAARGHDNCAFVTIGTGIGAGIMIGGRLHHGHHWLAGEIALMCMAPEYVETDFGSRGCLESLAGLRALSDRWSHPGRENEDSWVGALLAAAQRGDPLARKAVHETTTLLGMAVANLSVVLDPSIIVVGGPLFANSPALIETSPDRVADRPDARSDRRLRSRRRGAAGGRAADCHHRSARAPCAASCSLTGRPEILIEPGDGVAKHVRKLGVGLAAHAEIRAVGAAGDANQSDRDVDAAKRGFHRHGLVVWHRVVGVAVEQEHRRRRRGDVRDGRRHAIRLLIVRVRRGQPVDEGGDRRAGEAVGSNHLREIGRGRTQDHTLKRRGLPVDRIGIVGGPRRIQHRDETHEMPAR